MRLASLRIPAVLAALSLALPLMAALPGEKLDSGLGDLPHYRHWVDKTGRAPMGSHVAGESLDNGLGSLPHYRHWVDKSGRDPMGERAEHLAQAPR
ncbi:MAG: hypothetical protein KIT17_00245 [Rubrivivax sp.]|nr:hypothetical protein [Rubrivivax sp.]